MLNVGWDDPQCNVFLLNIYKVDSLLKSFSYSDHLELSWLLTKTYKNILVKMWKNVFQPHMKTFTLKWCRNLSIKRKTKPLSLLCCLANRMWFLCLHQFPCWLRPWRSVFTVTVNRDYSESLLIKANTRFLLVLLIRTQTEPGGMSEACDDPEPFFFSLKRCCVKRGPILGTNQHVVFLELKLIQLP